ncbi:MAG: flagellar hook capping FlgD N-terminal domain-containing protein [Phycisphaerae bacterium]
MSTISSTGSTATEQRDQYLKLLITQLQNQNPMDPMDNNQMASQLAQLSQLELTESMNSTFDKVLASTQVNQATAMIGKQVSWLPSGETTVVSGAVDGVDLSGSTVRLKVGNNLVDPDVILSIQN